MRRVVAVIESGVPKKAGVFFPTVRAWSEGKGRPFRVDDFAFHFPNRGNVYFHVSTSDGGDPPLPSIGLFECAEGGSDKSAKWVVKKALGSLAAVIDCPFAYSGNEIGGWHWLHKHEAKIPIEILFWQHLVYVRFSDGVLVGPFHFSDSRLAVKDQMFAWNGVDQLTIRVGSRTAQVLDIDALPVGRPIIPDPREAIHRLLKAINRTNEVDWLSRSKAQHLATALADAASVDGAGWVKEKLVQGLEELLNLGAAGSEVLDELCKSDVVLKAAEQRWEAKHTEALDKKRSELEALHREVQEEKTRLQGIRTELDREDLRKAEIATALKSLAEHEATAKISAQRAFEEELRRLSSSPASLALLASWCSPRSESPPKPTRANDSGVTLSVLEIPKATETTESVKDAITKNLATFGLMAPCASELGVVSAAAILLGQPVGIRSVAAEQIATAIFCSLPPQAAIRLDIPAGLLEPLNWKDYVPNEQEAFHVFLNAANRSALGLVYGTRRSEIIASALGIRTPSSVVVLGLDPVSDIGADAELDLGPIMDERWLRIKRFTEPRNVSTGRTQPSVVEVPMPELLAERSVPSSLLASGTTSLVLRRAFGALGSLCRHPDDASRLLFKYWIAPRIPQTEAARCVELNREHWASDVDLIKAFAPTADGE